MGEYLGALPVIESTHAQGLHYHVLLQTPLGKERAVEKAIYTAWADMVTRRGFHLRKCPPHIDLKADEGWIRYELKLKTKPNLFDAIDWVNVHTPIELPDED